MNPLDNPWGAVTPAASSPLEASAAEPVRGLVHPGLELEIAQERDQMWRSERRSELKAKLESAGDLERQGAQLGEFGAAALGLSILAGFVAYRFEHADISIIGKTAWVVVILAFIVAVVLFPLGWVVRLTARGRRAAQLEHARREAIDVDADEAQV